MAGTEPPLPKPGGSALLDARNIIVQCVEDWSINYRRSETIGHAGVVTWEFIKSQPGMAPRSLITVLNGRAERLAGGKDVQAEPTFLWYIITRGILKDRTDDGLLLVGEAVRFVLSDPFGETDKTIFCKPPTLNSLQWRAMYKDKDEQNGYSAWVVGWQQAIDLGSAGRERPGAGLLLTVLGTNEITADPNDDDQEFKVD